MQILDDESFSLIIHADHLSPAAVDVIGGDNVTPSLGLAVVWKAPFLWYTSRERVIVHTSQNGFLGL